MQRKCITTPSTSNGNKLDAMLVANYLHPYYNTFPQIQLWKGYTYLRRLMMREDRLCLNGNHGASAHAPPPRAHPLFTRQYLYILAMCMAFETAHTREWHSVCVHAIHIHIH